MQTTAPDGSAPTRPAEPSAEAREREAAAPVAEEWDRLVAKYAVELARWREEWNQSVPVYFAGVLLVGSFLYLGPSSHHAPDIFIASLVLALGCFFKIGIPGVIVLSGLLAFWAWGLSIGVAAIALAVSFWLQEKAYADVLVATSLAEAARLRGERGRVESERDLLAAEVERWQRALRPSDSALREMGHRDLELLSVRMGSARNEVEHMKVDLLSCVVCLEREKATVFLPCRHRCCCGPCGGLLTACPLCRVPIRDRIDPH